MKRSSCARHGRQRGAIIVVYVLTAIVLVGFSGLAINASFLYFHRTALQNKADEVALAAAKRLTGTRAGVVNARDMARALAGIWYQQTYNDAYAWGMFNWHDDAIRFSADPDASGAAWKTFEEASANPADLLYVKIDATLFDADRGLVPQVYTKAFPMQSAPIKVPAVAVAGQIVHPIDLLGVCALSPVPESNRTLPKAGIYPVIDELVEFGFRRGVGYNLLNLNPVGNTPQTFLLNPFDRVSGPNHTQHVGPEVVAPYLCNGTTRLGHLMYPGATSRAYVTAPFPARYTEQLNARFDIYGAGPQACNPAAAPPDANIKAIDGWGDGTAADGKYLKVKPAQQTAASRIIDGALLTVAELPPGTPAGQLPASGGAYGPLWTFSVPLQFGDRSRTVHTNSQHRMYPATAEPQGLNFFNWHYFPYGDQFGTDAPCLIKPSRPGVRQRRVLHVPLLDCHAGPVGSTATVLAVGRFLMTAPADGSATPPSIPAEFAGVVDETTLINSSILYK
jgi:hypothetical protein